MEQIRRASGFAWGLRLLCVIDGLALFVSLLLPLSPALRLFTTALLWGPTIGFVSITWFRLCGLIGYGCYHAASALAPFVICAFADGNCSPLVFLPAAFHAWMATLVLRFHWLISALDSHERAELRRIPYRRAGGGR